MVSEKHSFIEWTYVKGEHWNFLYEAIVLGKAIFLFKVQIKETPFTILVVGGFLLVFSATIDTNNIIY